MFAFILRVFEYLTPLSTLTYLSSKLTDAKLGSFTQWLIKKFIATYKINVEECEETDLSKYTTFNAFFTRRLKKDARPLDPACQAISPVDGTIGQATTVKSGRLIQAKGIDYSLLALLGGDSKDAALFKESLFCCTYLSPANYHRIHMPVDGTLVKTVHIPGRHFPVGHRNVSYMPDLFTKNERLVCFFETAHGPFALIMVGAALVGSIGTVWEGSIVHRRGLDIRTFAENERISFTAGDELGWFKFGSTVICLWQESLGALTTGLVSGQPIHMGEAMVGPRSLPLSQPEVDETKDTKTEQTTAAAQDAATSEVKTDVSKGLSKNTQQKDQTSTKAATKSDPKETSADATTPSIKEKKD